MSSRYGLWGPQALLDDLGKPHPEAIATVYFATVGAAGVVTVGSAVPAGQVFADAIGSPLGNPLPDGRGELQAGVDVHGNARFHAAQGYYALGYVVGGNTRYVFAPVTLDPLQSLVNGGDYANATAYPGGSVVVSGGFAFVARVDVPSTNTTAPVDGATWRALPPAGPTGPVGPTGPAGPAGPVGPVASADTIPVDNSLGLQGSTVQGALDTLNAEISSGSSGSLLLA